VYLPGYSSALYEAMQRLSGCYSDCQTSPFDRFKTRLGSVRLGDVCQSKASGGNDGLGTTVARPMLGGVAKQGLRRVVPDKTRQGRVIVDQWAMSYTTIAKYY
jgi:hypothetical protein